MNKNNFAPLPPMGWNSYDYYDTTVTEDAVKANADYMSAHLKESLISNGTRSVPVPCAISSSISRLRMLPWMNFQDCSRIRHVFHLLRTEPVLPTLLTISTVSV